MTLVMQIVDKDYMRLSDQRTDGKLASNLTDYLLKASS